MTIQVINRNSGKTLYRQISEILETDIGNNYSAGDYLPSEQELAARFSVNRHTLRRSIDELVAKGLVERHHGKGICVLENALDYAIHDKTRFTETLSSKGKAARTQVLDKKIINADGGVARRLNVPAGTPIIHFETLRRVDDSPFCIVSHFLNAADLPDLLESYQQGSLHQRLKEHYNIELQRSESLVTAALPQGSDAHYLMMPKNNPILRVKSINIDTKSKQVFEYALTRFRADRVQLSVQT